MKSPPKLRGRQFARFASDAAEWADNIAVLHAIVANGESGWSLRCSDGVDRAPSALADYIIGAARSRDGKQSRTAVIAGPKGKKKKKKRVGVWTVGSGQSKKKGSHNEGRHR